MVRIYLSGQLFKVLVLTVLIILFVPGCKTGELTDEITMLNEKQTFITGEKDSLQRMLSVKSIQYDTVYANLNKLNDNYKTLTTKNKSLQAGYIERGEQLKKVSAENAEISKALRERSNENDSIKKEIIALQQMVARIDDQKTEAEKSNIALAKSLQEKEMKIAADSIAEANKPLPPKESGFISITELGGGFGMGDISTDYSKSVLSINTIAGYRVNNHFIAGIGTGFNIYNGGSMIPLYLDFRYAFNEGKITPFFVADGGLLFNLNDFSTSGLFINPAFGFTKKLNNRVSFHISGGMLIQEAPSGIRNSFYNFKGGISFRGK
jgi:hypothetical protein